jgi:thiamine biosynthesis lipoprotein
MIVDRFCAMGTTVETWTDDAAVGGRVRKLFSDVEHRCSRFLDTSELSSLNRSATPTEVSPVLAEILRAADTARRDTQGLVDAGIGARVAAWGYNRSFDSIGDIAAAPSPAPAPEWHLTGSVIHRSRGTTIDLGGIAKGWTCDRAVEDLGAVMVNAGGDLRSADPDTEVTVTAPDGSVAATVLVGVGALASSSTGHRSWRVGSENAHHLIDPRTGAPATSPVVTATVIADTAAEAEAGAKAVLLLGTEGLAWASRMPWIRGSLVVWSDGSVFATTGVAVTA